MEQKKNITEIYTPKVCIYNSWHKYEQKLNDKHKVQFKRVSILEGDTASALHSLKSKVRKFKTFLIMRKAIIKIKKNLPY